MGCLKLQIQDYFIILRIPRNDVFSSLRSPSANSEGRPREPRTNTQKTPRIHGETARANRMRTLASRHRTRDIFKQAPCVTREQSNLALGDRKLLRSSLSLERFTQATEKGDGVIVFFI